MATSSKDTGDIAAKVGHHFEDFIRHYNNEDFDKALKSVNTILKDFSTDPKALHCKAVCLVQLSKFTDALQVLKTIPNQGDVLLLRVYSLYRVGEFSEIISLLPSNTDLPLELKEVKAQALYKLERYAECLELYKELLKKQHDDLDSERQSNLLAVLTQLQLIAPNAAVNKFTPSAPDTYELVFNAALLDMAKGETQEAEKKLRRAQILFQQFAKEEGLSPEKIKSEMITLKTQLLSVLLRKKRQHPSSEKLTSFNLDSMETNFLNQFAKLKKKPKKETADSMSPKVNPTGKTEAVPVKKTRSKRKPRLPKNFDPNVKPDPERWLPKIERSTYKKKKDKRGNIGKGTQGSTAPAEVTPSSQAGPSTPRAQHSAASTAAGAANLAGPRQQKPQAATKKQAKKRPRK